MSTITIAGPVQTLKTHDLLNAYNYLKEMTDTPIITLKPVCDTVSSHIHSKKGVFQDVEVDRYIREGDLSFLDGVEDSIVIIDEATFLSPDQFEVIYESSKQNVLTIITSLDRTYKGELWAGFEWWMNKINNILKGGDSDVEVIDDNDDNHGDVTILNDDDDECTNAIHYIRKILDEIIGEDADEHSHNFIWKKTDCKLCGALNVADRSELVKADTVMPENSINPGDDNMFVPVCRACFSYSS